MIRAFSPLGGNALSQEGNGAGTGKGFAIGEGGSELIGVSTFWAVGAAVFMAAVPEAAGITLKNEDAPPVINPHLIRDTVGADVPLIVDPIAIRRKDIGDEDIQAWLYDDEASGRVGTSEAIVGYKRDGIGARFLEIYDGIGVGGGSAITKVPSISGSALRLVREGDLCFWLPLYHLGGNEGGLRTGMHSNSTLHGVRASIGTDDDHPQRIGAGLGIGMGGTTRPTYSIYASIAPYPERLSNGGAIGIRGVFGLESEGDATFGDGEIPCGDRAFGYGNLLRNGSGAKTIMTESSKAYGISARSCIDMLWAGLRAGIAIAEVPRVDIAILADVGKLDGLIFAGGGDHTDLRGGSLIDLDIVDFFHGDPRSTESGF
jgi:hypothetical protein